ncbi:MAG: hypothetical protein OMM_11519 [Candidatus Magnetoglobus multicellularis str. Araruama]|uniref:Uncharacterized protein n=1 Tax=Candidatus Magnetoglobus multicellularis str. Araruama TaxID=890399 RepID=A0A1V1NY75_9BACT|nr:MAG: hypothetical protein OMM_11519 [Candidatus Magnetoglobus multicellularis str. Araruama]
MTEKELSTEKGTNEKPDFFSPANTVRIPGSSLRCMIRTLGVDQKGFEKMRLDCQHLCSQSDNNQQSAQYATMSV